jgi:hypothetical protein
VLQRQARLAEAKPAINNFGIIKLLILAGPHQSVERLLLLASVVV